jgi:hypothetical protein
VVAFVETGLNIQANTGIGDSGGVRRLVGRLGEKRVGRRKVKSVSKRVVLDTPPSRVAFEAFHQCSQCQSRSLVTCLTVPILKDCQLTLS